jgi:hypothetical protein
MEMLGDQLACHLMIPGGEKMPDPIEREGFSRTLLRDVAPEEDEFWRLGA